MIAEMVNQGTTKEDAMSLMVDAFGLPPSLDITNYDPIKMLPKEVAMQPWFFKVGL